MHDYARRPNFLASVASFLLGLVLDNAVDVSLPNTSPLLITHSAASAVSSRIPSEANLPKGLSLLLSYAMSSIR